MWRGEETELWRWIEERVGEGAFMGHAASSSSSRGSRTGQKSRESAPHASRRKVKNWDGLDEMGEREVGEAIEVTKRKLKVLEDMLRARKGVPVADGKTSEKTVG